MRNACRAFFFKGLFKRNWSIRITFWQIKGQTDCAWIFMLCSVNTGANGERFSSWWRCDRQRWTLRQWRQNSTPQVHRRVCARAPDYHVIWVLSTKQCCCGWFVLFHFVPTCEIPIKVPLKKNTSMELYLWCWIFFYFCWLMWGLSDAKDSWWLTLLGLFFNFI